MKRINIFVLFFLYGVFFPNPVFSHKVIIFAWVENGMIHSESSFGSKRKAVGCTITVVDTEGRRIHEGQTDSQGNYSFKLPEKIDSDLILKLNAGTGHMAQWRISEDELTVDPSKMDMPAAMKEKESLEKSPSVLKVVSGIGLIFLAAFVLKYLKRGSRV